MTLTFPSFLSEGKDDSSVSDGEGNGTPLQYSCLENPMDGGACKAAVHGVAKSRTRLSEFNFIFHFMYWRRKWQPTPVFLLGEFPWTEEPGGLQSMESQSQIGLSHGEVIWDNLCHFPETFS